MAPITLYESSIDLFIKSLEVLKHILQKAKEHAPEDSTAFPTARLHEDMLPLSFQVQYVSNMSKKFVERLLPAKGPIPVWDDNETTLDELLTRVEKSLVLLRAVEPKDLDGAEDKILDIKLGRGSITLDGKGYAFGQVLPQMFFHISIVYAILRAKGVPLGKRDFLNVYLEPYVLAQTPEA